MRILYSTRMRVGAPNGPGVNEATFLRALVAGQATEQYEAATVVTPIPEWVRGRAPRPLQMVLVGVQFALGEARHCLRIGLAIRSFAPDVHVVRIGPLPFGTLLATRRATPRLALKTYSLMPRTAYARFGIGRMGHWLDRRLQRLLLARAAAVDVVTPQIAGLVRELRPDMNLVVVENGVDSSLFLAADRRAARARLEIPHDAPVIAYVGGHPLTRGGREVLASVLRCDAEGIEAWGLVVGCNDAERRVLQDEVNATSVASRIRVLGTCSPTEVPDLMAAASVGLSLDDPARAAYYGSSSQKIRQYLAVGAAVVTFAGTNEFVAQNQLGTLVHDLDEVPGAVVGLLRATGEESDALFDRARRFAQDHLDESVRLRERLEFWRCTLTAPDS